MRIRLFSACVLSAWLAALAAAQTAPSLLPPLAVPPAPFPAPGDPPPPTQLPSSVPSAPPALVIEAKERPATPPGPLARIGLAAPAPLPEAAPLAGPPLRFDGPPAAPPGRFWMNNEVLLWWIQGTKLPPLVTTAPTPVTVPTLAGAPALGAPSIYGPGSEANNLRLGYRFTVGGYLDDAGKYALEANVFMTANGGNQFTAFSPGDPILARPVISAATNSFIADPIAVPGLSNGSIHIATRTTGILGSGIWLRENFMRSDDPCDTCRLCSGGGCNGGGCGGAEPNSRWYCRFDSLFGYRYQRLSDNLEIDDTINAIAALNGVPAGGTLVRSDQFHASNTFHGIDLGMTGEALRGPWTVAATAKVAVGFNDSSIDIYGVHTVNGGPALLGGLLAEPTNMGHQSHVLASAIPELDLKLGYSLRPNVRLFVGYSFLYWYHVARAAGAVDLKVDPQFLTTGAPTGALPNRPTRAFEDRSIWMQGMSAGFEWRY